MTPKPHSNHVALNRHATINIAVDVDLTLLDTLTPWLDHYGVKLSDINPHDELVWKDLSPWLEEHGTPSDKYEKPYAYWNDPLTYIDAKLNEGVFEFLKYLETFILQETQFDVNFFICSSCTVHHKVAKMLRIKELCGDFFNGFVDTADKHLVDFDILFDDSPDQILNAAIAGKFGVLVPTPMNNVDKLYKEYISNRTAQCETTFGNIFCLTTNESILTNLDYCQDISDSEFLDGYDLNTYNGFWKMFLTLPEETKKDFALTLFKGALECKL